MPEMDGVKATIAIRKEKNKNPIIAMTAGLTKDEITRCRKAGANDFVPKPFNPDELVMKMAKHAR